MKFLLIAIFACLACVSSPRPETPERPDRSVLTAEMLRQQHFENVYVAIEALRSNWLRERGPDSFASPSVVLVYFDNVRLGGVEQLKQVNVQAVASIKRLDGLEATARWGVGHAAGVIALTSWAAAGWPTADDSAAPAGNRSPVHVLR